ncbi:DNA damage response protein [Purpureocillium lavendulum]|uniref:DNA damage response protein n=1 Tax=Purpureocillium lavendulum TaxID=1247861 RepID=A0AB34FPC8_9HYPO|nr:DNA damage response protein [Purpureocillium lavendulum]
MKHFAAAAVLLASLAAADKCKPATYRCEPNKPAWDVCNTAGDWVFVGRCPPGTECRFNEEHGSPYCLPRHYIVIDGKCKPATYRCEANKRAWDVCNTSGDWVFAGRCPPGTVCMFNKQNGSPYCLPRRGIIENSEDNEDIQKNEAVQDSEGDEDGEL